MIGPVHEKDTRVRVNAMRKMLSMPLVFSDEFRHSKFVAYKVKDALLGDPALVLSYPDSGLRIDSVNGQIGRAHV